MTDEGETHGLLAEAGVLPREMPHNFTYDKVREVLTPLGEAEPARLGEAVERARALEITGPLATVIFIRHHTGGAYEVEVDRLEDDEAGGGRYAVLIYPEGEVPVKVEHLPEGVAVGCRLQYQPAGGKFIVKKGGEVKPSE